MMLRLARRGLRSPNVERKGRFQLETTLWFRDNKRVQQSSINQSVGRSMWWHSQVQRAIAQLAERRLKISCSATLARGWRDETKKGEREWSGSRKR
jgi:hypothetical protein